MLQLLQVTLAPSMLCWYCINASLCIWLCMMHPSCTIRTHNLCTETTLRETYLCECCRVLYQLQPNTVPRLSTVAPTLHVTKRGTPMCELASAKTSHDNGLSWYILCMSAGQCANSVRKQSQQQQQAAANAAVLADHLDMAEQRPIHCLFSTVYAYVQGNVPALSKSSPDNKQRSAAIAAALLHATLT